MIPSLAQQLLSLVDVLAPHGGQRVARRNAWAAMSQDAVRARARREADAALSLAAWAHQEPAVGGR